MVRGDLVGKGYSNVHCGVQSGTTAIIYQVEPTVLFFYQENNMVQWTSNGTCRYCGYVYFVPGCSVYLGHTDYADRFNPRYGGWFRRVVIKKVEDWV